VFVFPLDEVTVYPVMLLPPVAPAVNVTEVLKFPAVAVPIVGACGTDTGVTLFDALLADPVPCPFVAATVYVRAVPTMSATYIGLLEPLPVFPLDEVTV
jgi:hypothetical protein